MTHAITDSPCPLCRATVGAPCRTSAGAPLHAAASHTPRKRAARYEQDLSAHGRAYAESHRSAPVPTAAELRRYA